MVEGEGECNGMTRSRSSITSICILLAGTQSYSPPTCQRSGGNVVFECTHKETNVQRHNTATITGFQAQYVERQIL